MGNEALNSKPFLILDPLPDDSDKSEASGADPHITKEEIIKDFLEMCERVSSILKGRK